MKTTFYSKFAILLVFCFIKLVAQNSSEPIIVNPSIGDTLSLSERDYYQLFPNVEEFQFAVFYLNSDTTVNAEVHYLENGISVDILINNYKSLKSLNYQIIARNALGDDPYLMESEYSMTSFDKGAEVSAYLNDGEVVAGELLSIKSNSLLILRQECNKISLESTCSEDVSVSEINKLVIEGNSNLGWGIGLGILASVVVGAIIYNSNYDNSENTKFLGIDLSHMIAYDKSVIPILLSSIGLITLGVGIWIATSTPDEVIEPFSENDISGLSTYSRYQNKT